VKAEKEGDKETAPQGASEALEQEKDEDGVQAMKTNADQMMTPSVKTEDLAIKHVGYQSERMPVADNVGRKGIPEASPSQAGPDNGVDGDISRVIKEDKAIFQGEGKNPGDQEKQDEAWNPLTPDELTFGRQVHQNQLMKSGGGGASFSKDPQVFNFIFCES
jgi:hypothetical protein